MNLLDHISESLETILVLKILKFFVADLDPGYGVFLTLLSGFGIREGEIRIWDGKIGIRNGKIRIRNGKIRIRDKHPGSETLLIC